MMKMLAKWIYCVILKTDSKLVERIFLKLRNLLLKLGNPLITLEYNGVKFIMPFSHMIFIYQKQYPKYDRILAKIARYIWHKQGFLNMIDVGANIGDSACFVNIKGANYLLIEGEMSYASLIEKNLSFNIDKFTILNGGGESCK